MAKPGINLMSADLLRDADLCVKCGLCLPHCPTYQKTQDENESPRGRIALIQAWASGALPQSAAFSAHLDNCLLCRSCERVCPAQVPYGRLLDGFRAQTANTRKDSLALALGKSAAHSATVRHSAQWAMRVYRQSGLAGLSHKLNISGHLHLEALERLVPSQPQTGIELAADVHSDAPVKGRVGLFSGCMGALFDQETLSAAQRILTLAGYEVHCPAAQTCCGALDLHSGDAQRAVRLEEQNGAAFDAGELDAIVSLASGCGATLQEYSERGFAGKVVDISRFLLQNGALEDFKITPLAAKIVVHTPCSLANVMRDGGSVLKLLQQIPEAELLPLPETLKCCGSAGSYMLDHSAMAQTLLNDVLAVIRQHQPRYVVTSNIGCALHIRAGLKEQSTDIEVLHPVALLSRVVRCGASPMGVGGSALPTRPELPHDVAVHPCAHKGNLSAG
jgi:glycolate oxidase iron-sulfur subunit